MTLTHHYPSGLPQGAVLETAEADQIACNHALGAVNGEVRKRRSHPEPRREVETTGHVEHIYADLASLTYEL